MTPRSKFKVFNRTSLIIILLAVCLICSLGGNVYMYTLMLRHYRLHNIVRLDPLQINDYPDAPPKTAGKSRVVFFGDSRALGWTSPSGPKNVAYINRGIAYQTTAQILARFDAHVAPLHPDVVVIQAGINDLKNIPVFPEQKARIIRDVKRNIREMVQKSRAIGARVILTTVFPLGDVPLIRRPFWSDDVAIAVKDVNRYIKSLKNDNVRIFDSAAILSDNNGVCKSAYQSDLLHLVRAGYDAMNIELQKTIESLPLHNTSTVSTSIAK